MIQRAVLFLVIFSTSRALGQQNGSAFDRQAYYQAMSLDKLNLINEQLDKLNTASIPGKDAYEGAMTMKKAGLNGNPDKKLRLFKSGHRKLEAAIHKDSNNVEFRFLRLMIQEHAPGVLGYKGSLKTDSDYIHRSYKTLSKELQVIILDYSKKSKILKLGDS